MPKETIFRATDPDGGHHYRGSVGRTYTHAILLKVGDGPWHARGFAGRRDLADKAVAAERKHVEGYVAGKYVRWNDKTEDDFAKTRAEYAAAKVIAAPVVIVDKRGA